MTSALTFQNTQFDVIKQKQQIWLTAPQIGTALGYKSDDAISRIYRRNSDEFSDDMSETVNLTVSGNLTKSVRVFSLRGAHLIAMFSRTPMAKEFRKWVLDLLDDEVKNKTECVGLTRVLMVFKGDTLVDSIPVAKDAGIVPFSSPEVLQEMLRDTLPDYVLVHKKKLLTALNIN